MTVEPHLVQRQVVDLSTGHQEVARLSQSIVHRVWEDRLVPIIDQVFSDACPSGDTIVIDRLEVDLGSLPLDGLENGLAKGLEALLREQISMEVSRLAPLTARSLGETPWPAGRIPRVLHFLRSGTLPWWSPDVALDLLAQELDEIVADDPRRLTDWLGSIGPDPSVARRLFEQFGSDRVAALTALVAPRLAATVGQVDEHLSRGGLPASMPAGTVRAALWAAAWASVGRNAGTVDQVASREIAAFTVIADSLPPNHREPLRHALADLVAERAGALSDPSNEAPARDADAGNLSPRDRSEPGRPAEAGAERSTASDARTGPSKQVSRDASGTPSLTGRESTEADPGGGSRRRPVAEGPADTSGNAERGSPMRRADTGDTGTTAGPTSRSETPRRSASGRGDDTPGSLSASQQMSAPPTAEGLRGEAETDQRIESRSGAPSGGKTDGRPEGIAEARPAARMPVSLPVSPLLPDLVSGAAALPVANAGLVILWPFLDRFFGNLGYVENGKWRSDAASRRAVHLMQFLATGETAAPEYRLLFNKLLCGLAAEEPVSLALALDQQEKSESVSLLNAVIEHWSALKTTSADGLRRAFLQRNGLVKRTQDNWILQVDPAAHDVLMEWLPWSLAIVRLPWMTGMIEVQW